MKKTFTNGKTFRIPIGLYIPISVLYCNTLLKYHWQDIEYWARRAVSELPSMGHGFEEIFLAYHQNVQFADNRAYQKRVFYDFRSTPTHFRLNMTSSNRYYGARHDINIALSTVTSTWKIRNLIKIKKFFLSVYRRKRFLICSNTPPSSGPCRVPAPRIIKADAFFELSVTQDRPTGIFCIGQPTEVTYYVFRFPTVEPSDLAFLMTVWDIA
ncbi:hypothetical protein K435DRAFT_806981 [Dendrothele bispora CBS 962.96]|uniref:Uncharacterized protein n=1 Tax=Dendrothele bispora (strain CBS 962.96) TaxID=1314807 RepID=A0A4S8L6M1_DENBC|nr:hypothetical protein K435DRAFT_806981 [Dendrothele bispora CBS 962.96]